MPAPAPCAGPCINTSPPAERELGSSFHSFLYSPGLSALRAPRTLCSGRSQLVEKPLFRRIRPRVGGGARGGGSPPRMGSNAPEALLCSCAGIPASEARTFPPRSGAKVTAFLQAVGKVFRLLRQPEERAQSALSQLVKKPLWSRIRSSWGGGARGAAARLEWDQMPRKPCCARIPASEARTFPPRSGGKVRLLRQPESAPNAVFGALSLSKSICCTESG